MREVSRAQVFDKMRSANPWWQSGATESVPYYHLRPRRYFTMFRKLAAASEPRRAVLLMGPRRVGKTVLVFHWILSLIKSSYDFRKIFYFDLQQPLYNGLSLDDLVNYGAEASGTNIQDDLVVCFDEIQYLRDWEIHLKVLVDSFPNMKFVATGSAASTLRLKSRESGAGRFTDFLLPPLTFYEYMDLIQQTDLGTLTIPIHAWDECW